MDGLEIASESMVNSYNSSPVFRLEKKKFDKQHKYSIIWFLASFGLFFLSIGLTSPNNAFLEIIGIIGIFLSFLSLFASAVFNIVINHKFSLKYPALRLAVSNNNFHQRHYDHNHYDGLINPGTGNPMRNGVDLSGHAYGSGTRD